MQYVGEGLMERKLVCTKAFIRARRIKKLVHDFAQVSTNLPIEIGRFVQSLA